MEATELRECWQVITNRSLLLRIWDPAASVENEGYGPSLQVLVLYNRSLLLRVMIWDHAASVENGGYGI
jgi:hypothetical protein